MGGVSTSAETLAGLRTAVGAWASEAAGIAAQASAAANALVAEAERELRVRSSRRGAVEAALSAAPEGERARLAYQLRLATESLERARRGHRLAQEAARGAQSLQRRVDESAGGRVPAAAQVLARKLQALTDYRGVTVAGSPAAAPAAGAVGGGRDFGVPGIVDVPIERAGFTDNPILDGYHRGGAELSDYRWAVETWETVVRPGVLAGKTREDFERRDAELGRHTGLRRTAGVYDMFLGSDPIQFSRRADGSVGVENGRHRVGVAQRLGITHLPGQLRG